MSPSGLLTLKTGLLVSVSAIMIVAHETNACRASEKPEPVSWRLFVFGAGVAVVVNLVMLGIYRGAFVARLGSESTSGGDLLRLLLYGARMDVALLSLELAVVVLATLVVRARYIFWLSVALTYFHCIIAVSNFFFFRERNLPLGEKLFAYLLSPLDLLVYGGGFVVSNPWISIPLLLMTAAYFYAAHQWAKRLHACGLALPRSWGGLGLTLAAPALLLCLALDLYEEKRKGDNSGFKVRLVNPRYYERFDDYVLNKAAGNPFFDLLRVYAPGYLKPMYRDRMDPAAALHLCRKETSSENAPTKAPLLKSIEGLAQFAPLALRNVVIIQVEGLSQCMMARHINGRPVMKFLNQLAAEGIYCPNIVQGFSATAGGVFTTATSFPKGAFQERARRFTSYEMNATYATLPHILGRDNYAHIFAAGFRESYQEYISFMSNQGFTCHGYSEIGRRLKARGKHKVADDLQGYFDSYFLDECAEIIGEVREPNFVMHLITLTSHSPWVLPPGFPSDFEQPVDRVFDYVDSSIESFVAALKKKKKMEETVLVVIADHTSVTFGNDFMERVRIPLIVYSEGMKDLGLNRQINDYGSQMDVVPTILSLLPGKHDYAGFGRTLLEASAQDRTLYSGFSLDSWVFANGWALSFNPNGNQLSLYGRNGDTLELTDVSSQNPGVTKNLQERLLSIYETSRRLAREQRVFPGDMSRKVKN